MDTQTLAVVLLVTSSLIYHGRTIYRKIVNDIKLRSIPTVGTSDPLTSYIGAFRFLRHSKEMVQEGYDKYHRSVFRVPMMTRWMIIVSGPDKVEDMRRASDDVLSQKQAAIEAFNLDLSFGRELSSSSAPSDVIRTSLTRNIGNRFPDVHEEIVAAFNDHIPARSDEWFKITAYPALLDIICRASNRMLVGLPLCRDPDYLELNKRFAVDLIKTSYVLSMVPFFLRPIVARFMNGAMSIKRGMKHIGPLVKERVEQEARYGKDWPGRPNDVLTWLFEASKGKEQSLEDITIRILFINLASIHQTTIAFTYTLFDLATHPEYVQPLREEIEGVLQEEGWTKTAMGKMSKLDSFFKETMRLSAMGPFIMPRKAMKDFTFSDGTTIPAGNIVSLAASCMQTDPDYYPDPNTFDGFRFHKMREQEGESSKYLITSLDLDYVLFSHGRHACPGRFFAANEVKAMLAHIVLNYDIKMANGGGRPGNEWYGRFSLPNTKAEVLFRKRL